MALRFLIAAFATFLFARSFRPRINKDTLLLVLFTFLSTLMWIYGLKSVSAAQSAVLSYTMPLFAIPFSTLILNEKSSRMGWVGALVGFVGVAIYGLALAGNGGTVFGATLTICDAVFWALYTIYIRKMRNQDATTIVGTQFLLTGILFSVFAPFDFGVTVTLEFLIDLGFASIMGCFCLFILWNAMLRRETVGRITTISFAVPAMTTVIETIETRAIPSYVTLSGIGIIFLGIYISRFQD